MNRISQVLALLAILLAGWDTSVFAYPPAVGILGKSQNCLACHTTNGGWKESADLIIDIIDKATGQSLRQPDGSFKLAVKRGRAVTVMTAIGYRGGNSELVPYRNAWLYVAPETIDDSSLSKFLPGWDVNLTRGESVKGSPKEGMLGSYFERKLFLEVRE